MKTPLLITGGAVAVVALSAWLRWSAAPVIVGFAAGRQLGSMEGAKAAGLRGTR